MKMYRVEFTPGAKQDMLAAAQYIASEVCSPEIALAWYEGMFETLMGLKEMPRRFAYARENEAFDQEVRQVVYQSHRAIFTVHDDLAVVLVHRVWHTARKNAEPDEMPSIDPSSA